MEKPSRSPNGHPTGKPWRFDTPGAALRELRGSRGLSLRALAPKLAVSYPELSRMERGEKPVPVSVARAAERFFVAELKARDAVGALITSAAPHPALAVAPLPPRVLVGREREQAHLVAALGKGGISTVDGPPGVGASAVVAAAAHEMGSKYRSGGVLVADFADNPTLDVIHQVLGRWLSVLGLNGDDVPAGTEQRASALRLALRGRPALLIIENAVDSAQVRPLRPLADLGVDVIVSGHRRTPALAHSAATNPLTLSPLAPETGAKLLRTLDDEARLDAVPDDQLAAISRLCSGLPSALHTVSAHLRRHEQHTVQDIEDALADPSQRLEILSDTPDERVSTRARLTRSYQALPANARWLFRTLGLHGGQVITLGGAAALAGQNTDTVRPGLGVLADAYMLEPAQPNLWIWHDLPLLLAGELGHRLEAPYQRIHAMRRWVQWLIRLTTTATSPAAGTAEHADVHAVLDAETRNLPAAAFAAAHHGQTGLIRQLRALLDQAGRPNLAERCEPADTTADRAPRWVDRQHHTAPRPEPHRRHDMGGLQ